MEKKSTQDASQVSTNPTIKSAMFECTYVSETRGVNNLFLSNRRVICVIDTMTLCSNIFLISVLNLIIICSTGEIFRFTISTNKSH